MVSLQEAQVLRVACFLLSLLAALKNNENYKLNHEELAAEVCEIDIDLKSPSGGKINI